MRKDKHNKISLAKVVKEFNKYPKKLMNYKQLAKKLVKQTGEVQLRHRELGLQYTLSEEPAVPCVTTPAAASTP